MGVESILDIPDDFPLSERQRRACTSVQTGEPWFSAELGKELESLKYPLYFMDFESVNPAIPRFAGMRPFDQLPFQWSLHVQRQPEAEPEHYEFLATDSERPPTRVHHFAVRCTRGERQHRCLRRVRIAEALGTRGVAARVRGTDQANPMSSLGFAAQSSETTSTILRSLGRTR